MLGSQCVLNKACWIWRCVCVCQRSDAVWMTDWSVSAVGPVVILFRPTLPASPSLVWTRQLPLYGISNAPLTAPLSPSRPVMGETTYVRSPCCFLISVHIQRHAKTLHYLLLLFTLLLFCMQNLLRTTEERVWHLLCDIYLATDYSTWRGGQ